MVESKQRGFTIIELMLFLGITGALFAALMFGVNASINQQRYRESVVSLSTLLQGEYSEVSNTRNDANLAGVDNDSFACGTDGSVATTSSDKADPRGGSKCVLLGKAIQITKGNAIDVYRVVGCEPVDSQAPTGGSTGSTGACDNAAATSATGTQSLDDMNDLDTLKSYNPKLTTDFDHTTEQLEWNSTLNTTDTKHDPLTASFLILRSPSSGLIRVFTVNGTLPSNLQDILTSDGAKAKLQMCVLGDSIIAAKQSVTIDPSISGPEGVVVNQADGLCS
ncbi:MAG: hypothetical protein JWO07_763 [Candidatus Saccharibacteria bacterium]|nr:hypothetical protein [Candidatus Saccharibacteria bacterium]